MNEPITPVKIPYDQLSAEALQGVIAQYISRDGPDSGHVDVSFQRKAEQVMQRLKSGRAIILYDEVTESCNIFYKDDPLLKNLA